MGYREWQKDINKMVSDADKPENTHNRRERC